MPITHAPLAAVARIGCVFLLSCSELPEKPEQLAKALEDGLRVLVSRTAPMVTVTGDDMRALDSIAVDLSGGHIDSLRRLPRPRLSGGEPAVFARDLSIVANPLSVSGGDVNLQLQANEVELAQMRQPDNKLLLALHRAGAGNVRMEVTRATLEQWLTRAATRLAQKQGVTVENVKLSLAQNGARELNASVTVTARKLLFRPVLNLAATISVSDDLVATVSDLKCSGDGPIATLACAAITPQFRRIEQRPFPLSALPQGEVSLHDVAIELADERVVIAANFGQGKV